MSRTIRRTLLLAFTAALLFAPLAALHAADDRITWLINYDGKTLPDATWTATGKPSAKIEDGALRLVDDSGEFGNYARMEREPGR